MTHRIRTVKPRKQQFFSCTFRIEAQRYSIKPLQPHPEVARKAYRMRKLAPNGEALAVYDVRLAEHDPECDCLGYLRWQKPCKHIKTLTAMGMLEAPRAAQIAGPEKVPA